MLTRGGGNPTFEGFISSIPPITWYMILGVLGSSILVNLGILSPFYLIFIPKLLLKLQVWRLITPFLFFGELSFKTLMSAFFLLQFSRDLENEVFGGRKADYMWMLILGGFLMLFPGYYFGFKVLSFSFQAYISYVGCNMQPEKTMGLMFLPVQIPALWFPFVLLGLKLLMSPGLLLYDIVGMFVGHFYYYFKVLWPERENGGVMFFMKTPGVIEKFFEPERVTNYTGRFQGRGRRLDD